MSKYGKAYGLGVFGANEASQSVAVDIADLPLLALSPTVVPGGVSVSPGTALDLGLIAGIAFASALDIPIERPACAMFIRAMLATGARGTKPVRQQFLAPRGADVEIVMAVYTSDGSRAQLAGSSITLRLKRRRNGPSIISKTVSVMNGNVARLFLSAAETASLGDSLYLFDVERSLGGVVDRVIDAGVVRVTA